MKTSMLAHIGRKMPKPKPVVVYAPCYYCGRAHTATQEWIDCANKYTAGVRQ